MIKFIPVGSKKEKGNALERIFGEVLIKLGYTNLVYNAQRIGEEIDVQGEHRVTQHPIKCQCKAHADTIGAPDLRTFFGDYATERSRDPNLTGLFISSSGFSGTALEWYKNLEESDKSSFNLIDDKELFSILNDASLICSKDKLEFLVSMKTQIPPKELSLILSERGIFWEIKFEDEETKDKFYILLTGDGKSVKRGNMEYLTSKPQLIKKNFVSLEIKEKVLLKILEKNEITIDSLISDINEPQHEIKAIITNLISEGIIKNREKLTLRPEIDSFLGISKYFKDSSNILSFMSSKYFNDNIKSLLIPYIKGRFFLNFTDNEQEVLSRIISVSPKALCECLFGDSEFYKNNAEHIKKLSDPDEKEKQGKITRTSFIHKLSLDLLIDTELSKNKELLLNKDIILIIKNTEITLSTEFEQFLSVKGEKMLTTFMKTEGPIKAGELVQATGPNTLLPVANALSAIGEADLALKEYDRIIEIWKDNTEAVNAATNNKGLVYLNQEQYEKAKIEFEKIEIDHAPAAVLKNLCRCYYNLNLKTELKKTLKILNEKFPEAFNEIKEELNL